MKPDTENIYQRKINQVIDYINANLHLPLRLDIIAGQVNVSERQLLRIMKGALNESLYAYVARQRVERAVLYMHTEDMSLADLASRVGYDNPQSFSKAFKKQFSVSPKAYMDKLRARLIFLIIFKGPKFISKGDLPSINFTELSKSSRIS